VHVFNAETTSIRGMHGVSVTDGSMMLMTLFEFHTTQTTVDSSSILINKVSNNFICVRQNMHKNT